MAAMSKRTYQILALGAGALALYFFLKMKKKEKDVPVTEVPLENPKANFTNPLVPHYGRPINVLS